MNTYSRVVAIFLVATLSACGDDNWYGSGFDPADTNTDPVIAGDPVTATEAGRSYVFVPTASDADGDALTFSVDNAPPWAAFDSVTGILSGTPSEVHVGTHQNIVVAVSDGWGGTASLPPFSITVEQANADPVITGNPVTVIETGQLYTFVPTASDANGDALTFSVINAPSWAAFDSATGTLSGTPSEADVGTHQRTVITVSDGRGGTDSLAPFSITVTPANVDPANAAPVIGGTPAAAVEAGQPYLFVPTANDADGDTLTFNVANAPSWAAFDSASGILSGTPADTDVGTYQNIVIAVSDGRGGTASLPAFSITVTRANAAPVIGGNPVTTVEAGQLYTFVPTASDPDGDALTFTVTNTPSWTAFDSTTGTLSGTPSDTDVGTYAGIVIAVADGRDGTASLPAFSITVEQANADPVIAGNPATTVEAGQLYTFAPTANDPDGDTLTFTVTNTPSWAAFDSATGTLSGTPADADVGTYADIVIAVDDGRGGTASLPAFLITVEQANTDPVIAGTPVTVVEAGQLYTFAPTASDPDGDTLTFTVSNLPSWAGFDTATGAVSGTPLDTDAGTYADIVITVDDGRGGTASLPAFSITVEQRSPIVGQVDTPGMAFDVAATLGYAYVADGDAGIQVVEIIDPANPRTESTLDTPGQARDVTVANGYVYVADGDSGLHVVDPAQPQQLQILGSVNTQGPAYGVTVADGYAYVADAAGGLNVVDVSDLYNPVVVGRVDTLNLASDVAIAGGYAYVANDSAGLRVVDVRDPLNPTIVATVGTPTDARGVAVANGYAYVADGYNGALHVVNVATPDSPVTVGSVATPGWTERVTVVGDRAYVADLVGLQVVDVSNPANPVLIGSADTPGQAGGVAVANGHAYLADEYNGLQIVPLNAVSPPAQAGPAAGVATLDWARNVAVENGYAYVADDAAGVQVVDVRDPANARIIGNVDTPGDAYDVTVADGYAYVADWSSGLQVLDLRDPANRVIAGSAETPGAAAGVAVADGYAYLADGFFGLQIVNVSNPASPAIVASADTPGLARDVAVAGGYAYVADDYGGLQVIDVSDPANPVIGVSVTLPDSAEGVAVANGYAYVADGSGGGLQVVDVADPANPVIVGSVDTPGDARAVAVAGVYAYVADRASGLRVVDTGNPASPVIVGGVDTPSDALGLTIAGGYAYVADGRTGLQLIDLTALSRR